VFNPTYSRDGQKIESPNWAVEIQYRGKRHKWSLGTANKAAAAARAKEIYLFVAANGWNEAFEKFRPELAAKKPNVTLSEFLAEIRATAGVSASTIEDYSRALRKIVADMLGLDYNPAKYDYRSGGYQSWLAGVESPIVDHAAAGSGLETGVSG
jgi:hypothetical protein